MDARLDAARPPRLVLRFAVYAAIGVLVAAAGVIAFTSHYAGERAEQTATFHTRFVANSVLRGQLRPSDFEAPITRARLAQLDRLFRNEVLVEGALRAKLYSPGGRVTYSDDHTLIGSRSDGDEVVAALAGDAKAEVTHLNAEGGTGKDVKVLESFALVRLGGRTVGVLELYQDYAPISQAARETFLPIAFVLAGVLGVLYIALIPILRRTTARLREQMEEIEHQALHDALTGLPNRVLFRDRVLQVLLAEKREPGRGLAVLLIDLDRFKEINDTLGHESGDRLLTEVGRRLVGGLRESDTVARLGGDEFAVLASGVPDEESALAVARRLRNALETPFSLGGLLLEVEASIGIAVAPWHGMEVDTLMRHADVAMYVSKETHSGAEVYSAERDEYSTDRLELVSQLRGAIRRGELVLHYQPKIALRSGEVLGFEALVRWQHPDHGLVGPDRFLPFAERTGLIRPLTRHVLDVALRQCKQWSIQGVDVAVAVNLSSRDLLDLHFPDEVERLLDEWQIEPGRLELEITERVILSDPVRTRTILGRLKALGIRLSIDDFGSGYSSLSYLKRLPLDVLKIDKSFVLNMLDDDDAAIVRSTIDLAHNLGLEVVAEGVETEEVRAALVALSCDTAQGYFFSKPMAAVDVPSWLADARRLSSNAAGRPAPVAPRLLPAHSAP